MSQRLTEDQAAQAWIAAGGPRKYARVMGKIAMRESGGNPRAYNGKGRDNSYGLWQINVIPGANTQFRAKALRGGLWDPIENAKAAVSIFKSQGLGAWSTHNPAIDAKYIGAKAPVGSSVPGPSTRTVPGKLPQSRTDVDTLLLDSVMSHAKNKARDILHRLDSGQYTVDTPGTPAKTVKILSHGKSKSEATDPHSIAGTALFEGHRVAGWIAPILRYARAQGWKGTVNSGFRTLADQTRIYNSGVRPAAKPGTSNHEGAEFPRGAVDVSDAAGLNQILRGSKYANQLVWAGAKDPPHFSHPHNGSY